MNRLTGNRITDNAFAADDGKLLIERALAEIKQQHGWRPRGATPVFSGMYYDRQKVGSFLTRVTNARGVSGVLKLQLRPLPFDEGMIIRHVQSQIRTPRIRLPNVIFDVPWNASSGYGFLLMEDLTQLPHLWAGRPNEAALQQHEAFLAEFMHHVLPIAPYLPIPSISPRGKYREALDHFSSIANASRHHHIDASEVEKMKAVYREILERVPLNDFHFTHGHLSGHEIVVDHTNRTFVVFANLLWSFRPTYYELIFPLWVDLMGIRDTGVALPDLLERIDRWAQLWQDIEQKDPRTDQTFWFLLLERAMMTVMLDLGASEWQENEQREKRALLMAWENLFYRILENRFPKAF